MNLDLLREMIDRHEGNRLKKYRCPAGHWTIGRGWNLDVHSVLFDGAVRGRKWISLQDWEMIGE